ncbi:MAG: flagellar hook assembly protein FlgD [Oleiphilus sp.]
MSEFNTQSVSDALSNYRYEPKTQASGSTELGKNEFMKLMIAQMENQNPLEPQDNGAFISQLAEFSSLEEMQKISGSVNNFSSQFQSSQALQASAMVGRTVLVPASTSPLSHAGTISGVVDLEGTTSALKISILNGSGELVNQFDLGPQPAGTVPFVWDGTNNKGEQMPFDNYTIQAQSSTTAGTEQATTLLSANVNSVSIAQGGGISLNLSGMGAIPLEQVREIN